MRNNYDMGRPKGLAKTQAGADARSDRVVLGVAIVVMADLIRESHVESVRRPRHVGDLARSGIHGVIRVGPRSAGRRVGSEYNLREAVGDAGGHESGLTGG